MTSRKDFHESSLVQVNKLKMWSAVRINGYAWLRAFATAGGVEESSGDVCCGKLSGVGENDAYVVELLSGPSLVLSNCCLLDIVEMFRK